VTLSLAEFNTEAVTRTGSWDDGTERAALV
jgi:hypothetical protein